MTQQARVSGTVIARNVITGRTDRGPWKLHLTDVFLKGGATTTVTFMEADDGSTPVPMPRVGDLVDYLVEFSIRTGNKGPANLSVSVLMDWEQQANILGLLMSGQVAPAALDIDTGSPRPAAVPGPQAVKDKQPA